MMEEQRTAGKNGEEGVPVWKVAIVPLEEVRWIKFSSLMNIAAKGKPVLKLAKATLAGTYNSLHTSNGMHLYAYFQLEDRNIVWINILEGPIGPGAFLAMFRQYFAHYPTPNGAFLKFSGLPIMDGGKITMHDVVMRIELDTINGKDLHLFYTVKDLTSGVMLIKHMSVCTYPENKSGWNYNDTIEATNMITVDYNDTHKWTL
jgi:hypothetical protein